MSELEDARARRDELARLLAIRMGRAFPALDGMNVDATARTAEERAAFRAVMEGIAEGQSVGNQRDSIDPELVSEVLEIALQWIAADEEVEQLEARAGNGAV